MKVLINIADEDYKWLKRFCGEESEHFNKFKLSEISIAERLILNGTPFPNNATNGDMIKAMFPNVDKFHNMLLENHSKNCLFNDDWWNRPYRKE